MSSFSCPHYVQQTDVCMRLHDVCVPGRPGCVLPKNTVFAIPWQVRLQAKRQAAVPDQHGTHPVAANGPHPEG